MNPKIGILTYLEFDPEAKEEQAYHSFIKELLKNAFEKKIEACTFEFESIDFAKNTVEATYLDQDFKKEVLPLPKVVYIAGSAIEPARAKMKKEVRETLNRRGVIRLNPFLFGDLTKDKLKTHQLFIKNGVSQPKTAPFSKEVLDLYLKDFDEIFLKPRKGMQRNGMGILKKKKNGKFDLEFYYRKEKQKKRLDVIDIKKEEIVKELEKQVLKINKSLSNYIIQEGLELCSIRNKRLFFRSMLLRGKDGKIQTYYLGTRTFNKDGSVNDEMTVQETLKEIVSNCGKSEISEEKLFLQMKDESKKGLKALEKEVGPIGEIGFDLVLDREGKPWVVEANAKPGHILTPKKELANTIIDYLIFLSKNKNNIKK